IHVSEAARSAQLADITGDKKPDLIIQGMYQYPLRVFDLSTLPAKDVTNFLPLIKSCPNNNCLASSDQEDTLAPRDAAIADFNGDLRADIFLPRSLVDTQESIIFLDHSKKLIEAVLKPLNEEHGFSFVSSGSITFNFLGNKKGDQSPDVSEIFIGSNGFNPTQIPFVLNSNDQNIRGIKQHIPGNDSGVYIGYYKTSKIWKVLYSNSRKGEKNNLPIIAETSQIFASLKIINFTPKRILNNALKPRVFSYNTEAGKYVDTSTLSGFGKPILGQYVVSGDFDNDMDIDLYVSCSYINFDVENKFYRNQGNGKFIDDTSASGLIEKRKGPHKFNYSLGQKLAVADYDNDGFLDIFSSPTTFGAFEKIYLGASQKLFRNLGNRNHWIEINLRGTVSNRDGIGARVIATTNGISQLREQGGGIHQFAQNQQRIHFGLANNTLVDKLVIQWPSGIEQTLTNIPSDQILEIVEPSA
ncbi:MAG: CRTAC1 family protein, partial [Thermosynechococcaceae cyanobacterium]